MNIALTRFRRALWPALLLILSAVACIAASGNPSPENALRHYRRLQDIFADDYLYQVIYYITAAGGTFLLFYGILHRRLLARKIQTLLPEGSDIRREFLFSLLSIFLFSLMGLVAVLLNRSGWGKHYGPTDKYGWCYFGLSVVGLIFLHDTWFYWTHRLMHWRPVYRIVHYVHHESHNPTPWAAFSFHPLEALVEGAFLPLVILFLPVSSLAVLIWFLYMITMNVFGHLGYEILPGRFASHWLTKWYNTSVHHNMHHKYYRCNYGLYFNVWDRIMRTNHSKYEQYYDDLLAGRGKIDRCGDSSLPAKATAIRS